MKLTDLGAILPPEKLIHVNYTDYTYLVGGFNPFEKYARQIGSFPQGRVNIKNV